MLRSLTNRLLALLTLAATAGAQTVLFSDSFENGFTNWSATGLWHLENAADACGVQVAPLPEGQFCAYYGIDNFCNYDTGTATNQGTLALLTPIALPTGAPAASLHCWTRHQTEGCNDGAFDIFNIEISTDGGAHWTVKGNRCPSFPKAHSPPDQWEPRGIDLSAYLGQSVMLRFRFDTVDNVANQYRGAFVDKIEIRLEVGHPFCADGSFSAPNFCPCAGPYNMVTMGYGYMSGCTNSSREVGELAGHGVPLVANDTVVLNATAIGPTTVAILMQSDTFSSGVFSGDGLLCLTGAPLRLAVHESINGIATFPGPGDPPLSVAGSVPAGGGVKRYQVVYRDNGVYCTSAQFNWTNGYWISWMP